VQDKLALQIYLEPGAALVRSAACFVSTVVDIFTSADKKIAILDTTVNHMPEVFEYQFQPSVASTRSNGLYTYTLAGSSCLAGDLFGEYQFGVPLQVGSKIVFTDVGAYTLAKSHMFNGLRLPSIYALTESGSLVLKKRYDYSDYRAVVGSQCC
jgi:carboxynorspermidine decarboxylase